MLELIISICIAAAPALTSIIGIISAVIKNKKNVAILKRWLYTDVTWSFRVVKWSKREEVRRK